MNDWPARTDPDETAIGRPTPTARRLVEASVSPNTRRAYAGALRRLDAWLDGRELDDVALAAHLGCTTPGALPRFLDRSMAVAAACFRAKLAGESTLGQRANRPGARRLPADRQRSRPGPGGPFGASDLAAVLATRGDHTVQEIAARHEAHPNQVSTWKRQAIDGLDEILGGGRASRQSEHEATSRTLHAKITCRIGITSWGSTSRRTACRTGCRHPSDSGRLPA